MKKIILSVAAVFAFGFANAQDATTEGGKGFANGDIFITGAVGFNSASQGDFKSNSFTIAPSVGFFVSENIAVGARIGYTSQTADVFEDGDVFEQKDNTFEIGAFGRYYTTPASEFSFFAELGVGYMTTKTEFEGFDGEFKSNGFGVALAPGVSYFISSNFALEASIAALSYNTMKEDVDGAEALNNFGLNIDLTNIQLGLIYKF